MLKCALDPAIKRTTTDGFAMPLGVNPVEPITPAAGYIVDFEAADGDENEGDWEAWPDRYVFEATISATRLPALCRMLFSQLPGRVYPILDFLGHDAYREIDPYIAYEPVGLDRFYDGVASYAPFLYEDGLCGFGAMCDEPFIYIFVDEHKVLTLRAEAGSDGDGRERIEKVLAAFGLVEAENPAGADAAAHEHRSVLFAPPDRPDLMGPEEIVESLRDQWHLTLNVDTEQNTDDKGKELGMTCWRCLVRCFGEEEVAEAVKKKDPEPEESETKAPPAPIWAIDGGKVRYMEVLLRAECLGRAEEMAGEEAERLAEPEELLVEVVVAADRARPTQMAKMLTQLGQSMDSKREERIFIARWLE